METITKAKIKTADAAYGAIKDVYFDDKAWVVRYFIVDIGSWIAERRVLISPEAVTAFSQDDNVFETKMTKQKVAESPAFG